MSDEGGGNGVLLVNPPPGLKRIYGKLHRNASKDFPIGLAYIAAFLESKNVPVEILDFQVDGRANEKLKERVENGGYSVVGITSMITNFYNAVEIAETVKSVSNETKVVMGGTHPTIMPDGVLGNENVDVVVRGEGEITMSNLVRAFSGDGSLDGIGGISFKKEGRVIHNPPQPLIENLDELPLPARHLLDMEKYDLQPDVLIDHPAASLITSRGCPHRCIYCATRCVSGSRYRFNSPKRVLEEMEFLMDNYDVRQLLFWDDTFLGNRRRVEEICELLIRGKINKRIVWSCITRVDNVDEKILEKMHDAGCRMVDYGIETASPRLMKLIRKGITMDQVRRAVGWTKKAGIGCRATFMLGLPTETRDESIQTINLAKELELDMAKFSLTVPYPGTELYDMLMVELGDTSKFSLMAGFSDSDPVYVPDGRTAEELKELQRRAFREFYFRPSQILRMAGNVRSYGQLKAYALGAVALLR